MAKKSEMTPEAYEKHKAVARERMQAVSLQGRDIGSPPPVVDEKRRDKGKKSLKFFLETYFPNAFPLKWSQSHLDIIERIEKAMISGGLFALAMPRGMGKTTIVIRSALWATLYGHRKFVVIIGANETAAQDNLDTIKAEIQCNERLYDDFPEVCYPVKKLDGIINRCNGQLSNGEHTRMTWTAEELCFPTIAGSVASGVRIKTVGLLGRVRGMNATTTAGEVIRPDFVLIDDPQTDESAASPEQNRKRLRVLSMAILGLAGAGKKISGVMPCTVIRPQDMADQILDTEKHPEWNGERRKLLLSFPKNMELWNEYRDVWSDSLRRHHDIRDATKFYRKHRKEMDEGAESCWKERMESGEISAIQYAMNIYIRDKEAFYAEYQNEPLPSDDYADRITLEQVWAKMNGERRGTVFANADHLLMFIDVQKTVLPWVIMAFSSNFTGAIIDYGVYPEQKRRYYNIKDAMPSIETIYKGMGIEARTQAALRDLCDSVIHKVWRRSDGFEMMLDMIMVDSGWGQTTNSVYEFCSDKRNDQSRKIIIPSKGIGVTAAQKPMTEYRREAGLRIGYNWHLKTRRNMRYIIYDTNFWKSFVRERLLTAIGDPGAMTLYGNDEEYNRLLAEHLTSETSEPTIGRGRKVDIWTMIPGRENHWFDGVVGCYVGASIKGCALNCDDLSRGIINNSMRAQRNPAASSFGWNGKTFGV